jgi:glycosyltransferase involved in cell wall biosynthesis
VKVLFYLFFPGGGIGRYTHEQLKHLVDVTDIEVELACLPSYRWRDQATYSVWPGLRQIGHSRPWLRRARFLAGQFVNPWRLCARAGGICTDIVHFCNVNHLSYAFWRRKLQRTNAKLVATVHTVRRNRGIVNRPYETRQLKRWYRDLDALFVFSRAQADDLVEYAGIDPRKLHVVPHGASDYGDPQADQDSLRVRYHLPRRKQIALFFGDIRPDKNLDLFLRAAVPYREHLHLVVAGRGDRAGKRGAAWYKNLARELKLADHVLFLNGYVPDEQVPDLFTIADWVALPYSRTFNSQSGVLNVAMQYRRPVLASDSPTLAETMGQCDVGVLVESDDFEALRGGIEQMLERVATGHAHAFESYCRLFSWETNVRRTVAVYRDLMDAPTVQTDKS